MEESIEITGFIILLFVALVLLIAALAVSYSGKRGRRFWYRLFPPRCQQCGKKTDARPYYRNYNPKDPGSLEVEFLCSDCRAAKDRARLERWNIGKKKQKEKENGD